MPASMALDYPDRPGNDKAGEDAYPFYHNLLLKSVIA